MNVKIVGLALAVSVLFALGTAGCLAESVQAETVSPLGNKNVGKVETAIGDLVADALRSQLRKDIAFVAASELKAKDVPFPAGKVSSADIEGLISYPDDTLATLELDGKTIRAALEKSVSIHPQPNLGFLQVSGLAFTFDAKKPTGQRVTSVTVGGSPISDGTIYSVAVTNSMANGALGYWKVWDQSKITGTKPDLNVAKAIEAYLKANPKLDYGTQDRIAPAK